MHLYLESTNAKTLFNSCHAHTPHTRYGSGGKQATKKFKRNDTESASDISRTYSARKNKAPFAGSGKAGFSGGAKKKSGGSGGGGSKNKRPGKARRQSGKK